MDVNGAIRFHLQRTYERVQQCLADLSGNEARRLPLPGLSPVVWQVGHLAFYDALYVQRAGVGDAMPAIPREYEQFFKMGSGGEAPYPPIDQVARVFDHTNAALQSVAQNGNLSTPVEGELYTDVGGMLFFACIHRNYHIGKLATLRALLGKPILFGAGSAARDTTPR